MNSVYSLLIALYWIIGCQSAGHLLYKQFNLDKSFAEKLIYSASLGFGLFSLIIFIYGVFQLYHLPVIHFLPLIFISIDRLSINIEFVRKLIKLFKENINVNLYIMCILLFITFISVFAPASYSDWDSLSYHLTVPKLYIQHGGVYFIDYISHSNFPSLFENLYIPSLMLDSQISAKLINYFSFILLLISVITMVRRYSDKKHSFLAGIIITGIPLILWEATTAYIDIAWGFFFVAVVLQVLSIVENENPKKADYILLSLILGLCISVKMTALSLIPVVFLILIFTGKKFDKTNLKNSIIVCLSALITALPFYLKSIVFTGNPFYPFFYSVFRGRYWSTELADEYSKLLAHYGMGKSPLDLLMLPYNLLVHSDKFYDVAGIFIGPVLLICLPVCFLLIAKRRKVDLYILGLLMYQILVWFYSSQQSRFLLPAYILAATIIPLVLYINKTKLLLITLNVLFGFTCIFSGFYMSTFTSDSVGLLTGSQSNQEYLNNTLDIYPAITYLNGLAEKDVKIALIGDTRGYYLDKPYVWADYGHNLRFSRKYKNADEWINYLKSQQITHLLVNLSFVSKDSEIRGYLTHLMSNRSVELVFSRERSAVGVYEIVE